MIDDPWLQSSEWYRALTLAERKALTCDRSSQRWLEDIAAAFSREDSTPDDVALPGFLRAAKPLIDHFRGRLHAGAARIAERADRHVFDLHSVEDICVGNLQRRLASMLGRTLVLELNVARLNGFLEGATAEARFESFLRRLEKRETVLAFLQEYAVLARQLVICGDQWLASSLEFLAHLSQDFEAISDSIALDGRPGVLTEIVSDAGDRHRNGRSVLMAKFTTGFKVVYKPRSLQTDVHFNELLAWANEKGFDPDFKIPRVLDRGTHGWIEFIEPDSCASPIEVSRFYRRQGGNLALLYVLGATDFHHENLVAAGEWPVLLDLEALFTPVLTHPESEQAYQLSADALVNSVLRIGLLPHGTAGKYDFCGFGAVEGRLSPIGILQWERPATDEMRFVRKHMPMRGRDNRPTCAGQYVDMQDQTDSITGGFHDMYRLLREQREVLLSASGPLAAFNDDEVRVVVRPTLTYSHLLEESFHPDVLRDAADRDGLLDQLAISTAQQPWLRDVIPAEKLALHRGDVPLFTTRPGSRDLWTCSGQRIADFLHESGLARSMQRVRELGEDHLRRQLWVIQASLATQAVGRRIQANARQAPGPVCGSEREVCLQAAQAAGFRLESLAARRHDSASWIGLEPTGQRQWSMVPLGMDLYDGLPGVALFLAYLGTITQQDRFVGLARAALTTLQQLVTSANPSTQGVGGFSGLGGVIHTLSHLGVLWNESALIDRAEGIVRTLPQLIDQDEQLDIVGGAAGCLLSLLGLYRISGAKSTLDVAIRCGDVLIARATRQAFGAGWSNTAFGSRPLTGFAHGAAGIAYALAELAAQSNDARFRNMAIEAMAYERSVFDNQLRNWPDFREVTDSRHAGKDRTQSCSVAWCHGATGIGLGRLSMLPHFDDAAIRDEIETAVGTTVSAGLSENQSLCHGALGNVEFLLQAAQTLSRPDILISANRLKRDILQSTTDKGWVCGLPLSVDSPGLMTGLAGIGYGLLRLAEPSRVPSVLLLAPPHRSSRPL